MNEYFANNVYLVLTIMPGNNHSSQSLLFTPSGARASLLILFISVFNCFTANAQRINNKQAVPSDIATLQDSLALYKNARQVQDFYEKSGQYRKVAETRLKSDDPAKMHAGNDRKYEEVLKTIGNDRLTPTGKRKIRPEEYRVNIDKYRYRQRELSDYVLNTNAPMQLFDRRVAPQVLVDYTTGENAGSMISSDDVDFKMYDPIAVKPWSMLTPEEKAIRNAKYPPTATPVTRPVEKAIIKEMPIVKAPKPAPEKKVKKPANVPAQPAYTGSSEFIISGDVPDSARFRRFKNRKEAEDFINSLPKGDE